MDGFDFSSGLSLPDPSVYSQPSNTGTALQTLAGALTGGLSAYYDAQNTQPVYVAQPTPQTAYGVAGVGQPSVAGGVGGLSPTMLLILGAVVVAVLFLKK